MSKRKGFTIVEMLIVVVIIWILANALIPIFKTSQKISFLREKCFYTESVLEKAFNTGEIDTYIKQCKNDFTKVASECNLNIEEVKEKWIKNVLETCSMQNVWKTNFSVIYNCYKEDPEMIQKYYSGDKEEKNNIISSAYRKCFPQKNDIITCLNNQTELIEKYNSLPTKEKQEINEMCSKKLSNKEENKIKQDFEILRNEIQK